MRRCRLLHCRLRHCRLLHCRLLLQVSIFFIAAVVIGKYLLMNLLVAVILTEFADSSEAASSSPPSPAKSRAPKAMPVAAGAADNSGLESFRQAETKPEEVEWPRDYSLFCLGPNNPLRQACKQLMRHPIFDHMVILAILASSVCLALDSPRLDAASDFAVTLARLNVFFTLLFSAECLTKVIALGFAFMDGGARRSARHRERCIA